MFYMCTKFDDCRFSRSRDNFEPPKFKMGHMTLTILKFGVELHSPGFLCYLKSEEKTYR